MTKFPALRFFAMNGASMMKHVMVGASDSFERIRYNLPPSEQVMQHRRPAGRSLKSNVDLQGLCHKSDRRITGNPGSRRENQNVLPLSDSVVQFWKTTSYCSESGAGEVPCGWRKFVGLPLQRYKWPCVIQLHLRHAHQAGPMARYAQAPLPHSGSITGSLPSPAARYHDRVERTTLRRQ